jgi:hypothetical protein
MAKDIKKAELKKPTTIKGNTDKKTTKGEKPFKFPGKK